MSPVDLAKYLAIGYLFIVALGAVSLCGYDIALSKPIDASLTTIVTASIATALSMTGYHIGVSSTLQANALASAKDQTHG